MRAPAQHVEEELVVVVEELELGAGRAGRARERAHGVGHRFVAERRAEHRCACARLERLEPRLHDRERGAANLRAARPAGVERRSVPGVHDPNDVSFERRQPMQRRQEPFEAERRAQVGLAGRARHMPEAGVRQLAGRAQQHHRLADSLRRSPDRAVAGVRPVERGLVVPVRDPALRGIDDARPEPWRQEPAPVEPAVARYREPRVVAARADRDRAGVPIGDVPGVVRVDEVEAGNAVAHGGVELPQPGCLGRADHREPRPQFGVPERAHLAVRDVACDRRNDARDPTVHRPVEGDGVRRLDRQRHFAHRRRRCGRRRTNADLLGALLHRPPRAAVPELIASTRTAHAVDVRVDLVVLRARQAPRDVPVVANDQPGAGARHAHAARVGEPADDLHLLQRRRNVVAHLRRAPQHRVPVRRLRRRDRPRVRAEVRQPQRRRRVRDRLVAGQDLVIGSGEPRR